MQKIYLLIHLMFEKGGMMENEQQGVVFDQQKMVGQVVSEIDGNSSHRAEAPSIEGSREPSSFPLHLMRPVEMYGKALSQR